MQAQTTISPLQQKMAILRRMKAANDAAVAGKPAPQPMTDDEVRADLERGVPPADVLEDMLERGDCRDVAQARLDTIRGVGRVCTDVTPKPRVDIDDLFAGMPDAVANARLAALDLKCEPSVIAATQLAVASAALMGQVDVVLPPEVIEGGDEIDALINEGRSPFAPALTTYQLIIGRTAARKSEVPDMAGDKILACYDSELARAWMPKPGEAKHDPPRTRHSRATPAGLELALLENGIATIMADEGEDMLRAFMSGGDGKDQLGVLLSAKVGKYMARTIAGDRTSKKPIIIRTNNPRCNLIALVQDCFLEPTSEADRQATERLFRRGFYSRMDICEMEALDAVSETQVRDKLRDMVTADRSAVRTARSRWNERLRGLLPPVRPDGDRHPLACTLGSVKATLDPAAAAAVHRISKAAELDASPVRDFLGRAHINVASKAALLAMLRQGYTADVLVTLADVERAERFVFGYLLPTYRRVRD